VRLQLDQRWELAGAFALAACRYWLTVLPIARRELRHLSRRASEIPDLRLRRLALDVHESDWASLEGVAAFAAFARPDRRATIVRLLVRLQSIYQYTDTLMEQPSGDPAANARQLHTAILVALHPDRPHIDYYRYDGHADDGGYLVGSVDRCRALLPELPSYPVIAEAVLEQARGIVFYQSHINLAGRQDHPALARWAELQAPCGPRRGWWWETAAASGSSLAMLALLSAAADPNLTKRHAQAVKALYWPWMGALHTLLDSLIDRAEDAATGQQSLLDNYSSAEEMTDRIEYLAVEAVRRAKAVGVEHRLILAGMTSLYLSDPNAWAPYARETTERVLGALGGLARPAMLVLRARRLAHRDGPRASLPKSAGGAAAGYPRSDIR
jgi:tetraprenyl-beta-curcumene synthase